jgi:hypothetical protein
VRQLEGEEVESLIHNPTNEQKEIRTMATKKNQRQCAAKKDQNVEHKLLSLPTFGFLKGSVSVSDLAVGMAGGLLGQGVVKKALEGFGLFAMLPAALQRFSPLILGAASGFIMQLAAKQNLPVIKSVLKPSGAKAYMTGAIAAGAMVQAWQELQTAFPDMFNDYVYLPGNMAGVIVNRPLAGVLVDRPRSRSNLNALSALNRAHADRDAI